MGSGKRRGLRILPFKNHLFHQSFLDPVSRSVSGICHFKGRNMEKLYIGLRVSWAQGWNGCLFFLGRVKLMLKSQPRFGVRQGIQKRCKGETWRD